MLNSCRNSLVKKAAFCLVFTLFTPLTLGVGLFSLSTLKKPLPVSLGVIFNASPPFLYAALPEKTSQVKGAFAVGDARPVHVKKYLEKYDSPLLEYDESHPEIDLIDLIIKLSEKYEVDFRLPLAIAQCESNVCKKIPTDSYNCWGFENGETKFSSYEHALERVFKTLREGYLDQGLTTPEEIMPKYAPPSVEKGGPWAKCVEKFIREME